MAGVRVRWSAMTGVVALAAAGVGPPLAGVGAAMTAPAPAPEVPGALVLVLDASGSMRESDGSGSTRIETAKAALVELVGSLPPELPVGLRVFGSEVPSSRKQEACADTRSVVPVDADNLARLRGQIEATEALGESPIGLALAQVRDDLPRDRRGAVVLMSDGLDECTDDGLSPPPCEVATELGRSGVRVEVIGLQVEPTGQEQLRCIADATGGRFINVSDVTQLGAELTAAQDRASASFSGRGQPVEGGPSLIEAPELAEGSYTDSLRPDDVRWYAVRAGQGDALTARLTIATGDVPEGATVLLTWSDENGRPVAREAAGTTGRGQALTFAAGTGLLDGEALASDAVLDAGAYYLSVEVIGFPADGSFPFVLDLVHVRGAEASPAPSGAPTADLGVGTDGVDPAALPPPPRDRTGVYVLGGAVLTLALAIGLWWRRRRRHDEPPGYYG